jgi:hypothetical protein
LSRKTDHSGINSTVDKLMKRASTSSFCPLQKISFETNK